MRYLVLCRALIIWILALKVVESDFQGYTILNGINCFIDTVMNFDDIQ